MASIKIDDLTGVKPFDPHGDPSGVGRRWQRWMKSFSVYADSKGLIIQADKADNKVQRRALLLHSAGEAVQEIFETLAETGEAKDYEKAVKALNDYFIPKVNSTYQNHVFRSMEQQDGETVAQFVTRLRQVVKDCDYGEQAENQIRDQVVQRCKSHELRKKLLGKGEKLTLELVRKYLVAYRSTPHSTTGVSPAELLFGRKVRTKLPELREESTESEMRDRDSEMKAKAKQYADKKRNVQESDLTPGDKVLVKQERRNKLSTPFAPEPYAVVTKTGNSVVIESPEGVQLMRNTTHVKKFEESSQDPAETAPLLDVTDPVKPTAEREEPSDTVLTRPTRVKKLPERFKDFDMT